MAVFGLRSPFLGPGTVKCRTKNRSQGICPDLRRPTHRKNLERQIAGLEDFLTFFRLFRVFAAMAGLPFKILAQSHPWIGPRADFEPWTRILPSRKHHDGICFCCNFRPSGALNGSQDHQKTIQDEKPVLGKVSTPPGGARCEKNATSGSGGLGTGATQNGREGEQGVGRQVPTTGGSCTTVHVRRRSPRPLGAAASAHGANASSLWCLAVRWGPMPRSILSPSRVPWVSWVSVVLPRDTLGFQTKNQ